MGVKGFSKTFNPTSTTLKKLKGKKAAVDASVMIYQSALGMKKVNGLTDASGNPTLHINVIHSRILNFKANKIQQHWVFDYHEKNYVSPDKLLESKKRIDRKKKAQKKIDQLETHETTAEKSKEDELFSDSDEDLEVDTNQEQIDKLKKITFSATDSMFNDCKYLLNTYGIQWSIAPKGYEAEYMCAKLCEQSDCDFVYTTDVDALLYRAPILIRPIKSKGRKVLQKYILADILEDNDINQGDLIKVAMILGTDHAPKTPRIGPGTVLKKFKDIELTDAQKTGLKVFSKPLTLNIEDHPEIQQKKLYSQIHLMLDWLVSKKFNRERVVKQIKKVYNDFN